MAKYRFLATHGVEFSDTNDDSSLTTWAAFKRDSTLDSPRGDKTYVFETDDAKAAARLRKIDDYGITEDKKSAAAQADDEPDEPGDQAPAKSASKADWAAYAVEHGLSAEEADKLSRDDLAARFTAEK